MSLTIILITILTLYLLRRGLRRHRRLPPGPVGVPLLGSIPFIGPFPHHTFLALAKKHGPLMYLNVGTIPTVVVSDAAMAERFLRTHDTNFANRPDKEVFHCLSYGFKGFALTDYGPYWRNIRKLCVTHLLSSPKIASLAATRQREVNLLVKSINVSATQRVAVNVSQAAGDLVSDIVWTMIIGRKFKEDDVDGKMFCARTTEMMKLMSTFNVNDFIPVLRVFDLQGMRKKTKAVHEGLDNLLEKVIDEHLVNQSERKKNEEKDFVDVMLELMEREEVVEGVRFDRTTVKAIVLVSDGI